MPKVRIHKPARTAMQSGTAKTRLWFLEFEPGTSYFIEGLMGWSGMKDTTRQLHLRFPTKEAAIAYAEKHGLDYEVAEPKARKEVRKAYADNFKHNRVE